MILHIKNFQSIKDIELEAYGLTVIEGPSNIGKSAILRAAASPMFHRLGDHFVRTGASFSEVKISELLDKDRNSHTVLWTKGKKINQYVVDEEVYDSVGRNAPDIIKEMGFKVLNTSAGSENLIYRKQHDPPFMLFEPAKALAIISEASRISTIQKATKLASKQLKQLTSQRSTIRDLVEERQEELNLFDDLETFRKIPDLINQIKKTLEDQQNYLYELERLIAERDNLFERINSLNELPEMSTKEVTTFFDNQVSIANSLEKYLSTYYSLENVSSLPTSIDLNTDIFSSIYSLIECHEKIICLNVPIEVSGLSEIVSNLDALFSYITTREELDGCCLAHADLLSKKENTLNELKTLVAKTNCPTCGQPMDINYLP